MSARATYFVKQGAAVRCVNKQVSHTFLLQQSSLAAATDVGIIRPSCSSASDGRGLKSMQTGEQLEIVPGPLSKIGDGYATRKTRPRGVAVFDFRFRA